jgi:hypothetical protein
MPARSRDGAVDEAPAPVGPLGDQHDVAEQPGPPVVALVGQGPQGGGPRRRAVGDERLDGRVGLLQQSSG